MLTVLADISGALKSETVFTAGPVIITETVVVTWGIMAALTAFCAVVTSRLSIRPGSFQNMLEMVVEWVEDLIKAVIDDEPGPYVPLIATLFIYILTANLAPTFVPLIKSPTADISTTAALALFVFVATPLFGIRSRGVLGYLKTYVEPVFVMLPFNIVGELARTLALAVRLFGNVMSGQLIFAVIIALVPIVLAPVAPIPLQALGLLTGTIQAYVFAALAVVFIGGAVESRKKRLGADSGAKPAGSANE